MGEKNTSCSTKLLSIGGQAVMEGVMMKGDHHYAVAVRKPDGEIHVDSFDSDSLTVRHRILGWPFIRGVIRFAESLVIGMRTLTYSAGFILEEEEEAKTPETKFGRWKQEHGDSAVMAGTVFVAVLFALALFIALPVFLSRLLSNVIPYTWVLNIFEGVLRVLLFVLYIVAISQMKDIQRVYEYHGAEHKTIACYEAGEKLTPENVKHHSRLNRRCGTSFIFLVMVISIVVFMFIQVSNPFLRIGYRILLIPVVSAISYEILRLSARSKSKVLGAFVYPGLMLQKLTTREPDLEEIEVAIASTIRVLETEDALPDNLKVETAPEG